MPSRAEDGSHGLQAGLVIGCSLTRLGDFDLGCATSRERRHDSGDLGSRNSGHRRVDRDLVANRRRPTNAGGLLGCPPPGRSLGVVVLGEWRELAPTGLAVNQHALADVDSAKPPAQGNGVHMKFARFGSDHETSRDSVSFS
jgi:hypothetical protein